jgi:hypothetical protein
MANRNGGNREVNFARSLVVKWVTCILLVSFSSALKAQSNDKPKDTLAVYKHIKQLAYKRKATKLLFHAIFIDPAPLRYDKKLPVTKPPLIDSVSLRGYTIRKIDIIVLDPFGYSANDTSRDILNPLQSISNKTHVRTHKYVIKNRLLFNTNEKYRYIKITESERLLRESNFINDARIFATKVKHTDSVDILVIVHDKWSIQPSISLGSSGGKLRLRDRNFIGTGHTFEQHIGYYLKDGLDLDGKYIFSNIYNTYISANLFYATKSDFALTGISAERGFFSTLTKYAGGAYFANTKQHIYYFDSAILQGRKHAVSYNNHDYWLAKSFGLNGIKGTNADNLSVIAALRYYATQYQQRPGLRLDSILDYNNAAFYGGSLGISYRRYYKDQYIYRLGANEDIAEGLLLQWVQGYRSKMQENDRYYSGIECAYGKHFEKSGYWSGYLNYGTYYHKGLSPDVTLQTGIFYFTDLVILDNWYLRQFINCRFTTGINKIDAQVISIKPSEMYGFNAGTLTGQGKMLVNLETVAYAPYNLIGFKFAPVLLLGFGQLYNKAWLQTASRFYQVYSAGVLVRNESLLNSSFEFTVGFYPDQPGQRSNQFRVNPVTGFSLKIRSFAISKPTPVGFD